MQQEYENLNPLRIIRIAKDLNKGDFAKYFLCTTAYISALEHGKRKMRLATLRSGLNEMNISLDDYSALEKLRDSLININIDIDKNYMYRCMLAKALEIVSPELKEQAESLVSQMLQKTPKHR